MKTADVSKLFLPIFERKYDGLQHAAVCLNQKQGTEVQFRTSPSKKSPKKPNQKWVKYYMKAPQSGPFADAPLIVQFSKAYLKTLSWTFL